MRENISRHSVEFRGRNADILGQRAKSAPIHPSKRPILPYFERRSSRNTIPHTVSIVKGFRKKSPYMSECPKKDPPQWKIFLKKCEKALAIRGKMCYTIIVQ
jgi:hypothetical protein